MLENCFGGGERVCSLKSDGGNVLNLFKEPEKDMIRQKIMPMHKKYCLFTCETRKIRL